MLTPAEYNTSKLTPSPTKPLTPTTCCEPKNSKQLTKVLNTSLRVLSNEILQAVKDDPSLRVGNLTDLSVLRGHEWRYIPDTIKAICYGAAMEAHNGCLWAITAPFTEDLKEQIIASKQSPATFLKERFMREFGKSIPRAGVFEYGGSYNKDLLHVHMLLSKEMFPNKDELRQRLYRVFGKFGSGNAIHIVDTQTDKPFDGTDTFGLVTGGPEGWLNYGAKGAVKARKKLKKTHRRHNGETRTKKSDRSKNKRLQTCIDDLGLKLQPNVFFFDDMMFKSDCVLKDAKVYWKELHADFVISCWMQIFGE